MNSKTKVSNKKTGSADVTRKKQVEQWWLKYEQANEEKNEAIPRDAFWEFAESAYDAWLMSGKIEAQIEADIKHHIIVQKTFTKWRKIYGNQI